MTDAVESYDERAKQISELQDRIKDEALRQVSSYEDAERLAAELYEQVVDVSQYLGTGFIVLDDKSKLVERAFIVIDWRVHDGDYGTFASMTVVTQDGQKLIVNDGSSGIGTQLKQLTAEHGITGGLRVPGGLRLSEYETCPECGIPMSKSELECSNGKCGYEGEKRAVGRTFYLNV